MQLSRNIIIAIASILLLVAIPATILLVRQQQNLRSQADVATVTLSLSPTTSNAAINSEFTVDIRINAGTHDIGFIDVPIHYNSQVLNVLSSENLSGFTTVLTNEFTNNPNNQTGDYRFVVADQSGSTVHTGVFDVARIRFKAVGNGSSAITFGSAIEITATGQSSAIPTANNITGNYTVGGTTTASPSPSPSASVTSGNLPDLMVDSVTVSPSNPAPDTFFNVTAVISNGGNVNTAQAFPMYFKYRAKTGNANPSTWINQQSVNPPVIAGSKVDRTDQNLKLVAGTYEVEVCADKDGGGVITVISESNENNNCKIVEFTVGVSVTGTCTITNVSWVLPNNAIIANRGDTVSMKAEAAGDCAGKTVDFGITKFNGALGPTGCNIGTQSNMPLGERPFSGNIATASWITEITPASRCGPVIDGGPIQFALKARITTNLASTEVLAATTLKVREAIPNKVRVLNTSAASCEEMEKGTEFNYPTSANFTQIDGWNITERLGATTYGPRKICAQFGYKPFDSTVTDFQSYPPIVVNTINYQAPRYSISGNVFNDTNRNGTKDAGETGWVGRVPVSFPGVLFFDTDASGNYTIPNIPAGTYNVQVLALGAPLASALNWAVIRIPQGYELTTQTTFTLTLPPNGTANIGFVAAGTVSSPGSSASIQPSVSPSSSASVVAGCTPKLNGDADGVGGVDVIGDFITWRQEYLGLVNTRKADFDCDGQITVARDDIVGTTLTEIGDFLMWRRGYLNLP